jgi:FkbM family methyltransferase
LKPHVAYRLAATDAAGKVRCRVAAGVFLDLDLADWCQRLYYLKETDSEKLAAMCRLIPPGGTFFDVGAFIGLHTCAVARHVGPDGKVMAFEPMPENFELLRGNVRINSLDNVRCEQVALSDADGSIDLFVPGEHPGGSSSSTRVYESPGWRRAGRARRARLDDFQPERVDLIKIDVEGHEMDVLEGGRQTIACHHPVIVCEVMEHNRRAFDSFAREMDYEGLALGRRGRLTRVLPDGAIIDLFLLPR